MITTTLLLCALSASAYTEPAVCQEARPIDVQTERAVLRLYEVADLGFGVRPASGREASEEERFAPLLTMIRREIVFENLAESMRLTRGTLVANLPPSKHEALAELLDFQRASRDREILIESAIYKADAFLINGETVSESRILKASDEFATDSELGILTAPSILTLSARRASIFTGEEIAYVADYEVVEHVQPGDLRIEVPRIERVDIGISLHTRVHWVREGLVEMTIEVEVRELIEFQSVLDADTGRELNLPVVSTRAFDAHVVLAEGQSLFVTGDPDGDGPIGALISWGAVTEETKVDMGSSR